ncbi:MAG: hypothetical protein JF592_13660 [Microbacterium sp.]|uniref:hypothetical protein n=1 Tax=Microbacterium sp. TaxID=51671 RepID=UPI001D7118BE|nr:hypothetical protein [Microbacterium sp.]MBW8763608.1 hypothetical protein [Microbacterium sp.]
MTSPIRIHVDRDSVAMGDDVQSHVHEIFVVEGTPLSAVLDRAAPEIRASGWSWVAVVGDRTAAVWSVDHGVRMLVDDIPVTTEIDVFFRYFVQIDPEWLYARLRAGAPPHRYDLEREYAPLARERRERELRRRERESDDRYLSPEFVRAATGLGAVIDLHADTVCRFEFRDELWSVQRSDTMTLVFRGGGAPVASLRPTALGECWIIAALAAEVRASLGLPRFPEFEAHRAPELHAMSGSRTGPVRWAVTGPLTAQVTGDDGLDCFRIAVGRSITEIIELMMPTAG